MTYTLTINGRDQRVEADGDTPLLWILRDVLGLPGTKFGCGAGLCGCCTVHIDGTAARACLTTVDAVGSAPVTTIEGVGALTVGRAVQQAWIDLDVVQCGYCQPGQIMAASALLADNPDPSDPDIDAAMSGNLCRCGTYERIRSAVKRAAGTLAPTGGGAP